MNLAVLILAGLLGGVGHSTRTCPSDLATSAQIHWSKEKNIESPNCRWLLEIRPSDDRPADAYLKKQPGNARRLLFKLNRDGIVYWGNHNNWLFLEDQRFSNSYRLKLFNLNATESETTALRINKQIRADVEGKLKPTENINYYFPKFVAWADGHAVISVGVVTVNGKSGPFTPHCFAYEVGTQPVEIKSTLSEAELKKRYGASCQIWP